MFFGGTLDISHLGISGLQAHLETLLGSDCHTLNPVLNDTLFAPVKDFLERPRKEIRGELVKLGFLWGGKTPGLNDLENCRYATSLIEILHAGSLIVDDIEDNSVLRRGAPTLHLKYGLPIALNAGNWLYFWATELLEYMQVPDVIKLRLYQSVQKNLVRAHFGQAIDVGLEIDKAPQEAIPQLCKKSLELKSGSLMSLALSLGAILGDCDEESQSALNSFGFKFGMFLQMCDDLGNLKLNRNNPKNLEDLMLKRPTWIWWTVAEKFTPAIFREFSAAVDLLPDTRSLEKCLSTYPICETAKKESRKFMDLGLRELNPISPGQKEVFFSLQSHSERIFNVYL